MAGVENCYVFKSRLQEYAQKVGIPTPVYVTVKEGPSHEPVFKSTVIVDNVRYDSLPGFFNRKAAEQSAAEIALTEIQKSGHKTECIPILHETGLCKNLLQEYSQKMNYAIPAYICNKQSTGPSLFTCTVEIGGIQYIGAAAKTRKEAEIKAARTALLAIKDASSLNGSSKYTVLPGKKKGKEPEAEKEAAKNLKPKKANFKKKWTKRRFGKHKDSEAAKKNGDEVGSDKGNLELLDVKNESQAQPMDLPILYVNEHHPDRVNDEFWIQELGLTAPDTNGYHLDPGLQGTNGNLNLALLQ